MPYLQLGYKRIHYTDHRPSSAPIRETLILTHGLGSTQNYYGPILPHLLTNHFRCLTFDTTGAGRSPYTQIEQSIETLAADVLALLDALSIPRAVVVGHSMGGIVAAHLAATHPDRVVASVWIGPVYPSSAVADVFEKRIQTVEREGMEAMANTIPAAATGKRASPLVRSFIRELLLAQDARGYVSNCRVIATAKPPAYRDVKGPVLVLAGEEDKSAPLEGCKKMFEEVGTEEKRLEVLEGCGHWHCVEAWEEVGERIVVFLHTFA